MYLLNTRLLIYEQIKVIIIKLFSYTHIYTMAVQATRTLGPGTRIIYLLQNIGGGYENTGSSYQDKFTCNIS